MNVQTKIASPLSRTSTLVSVRVRGWTARKLDKQITDETNRRYNASADAGRFNKLLIAGDHMQELTSITSAARDLHYSMTLPWTDKGPRILPNKLYSKFTDAFRALKRQHADAVERFAAVYPAAVEARRIALNGAFKESDYPAADRIRSKFELELEVMPFPEVSDFRSDLDDDIVADIRREIEETSGRRIDGAVKHAAGQIVELVGHMAAKLKEQENKKEGERRFFMDSLVNNVRDLADLLPAFNLTSDPALDALTQRIQRELCVEDASALRKNPAAREAVAKSADEIVAEVERFLA
jgi:hypothetical protein